MTDLERFESEWANNKSFKGQRGKQTQAKYEDILFSIWKHHPDWSVRGFQISVPTDEPEYRTIYRVIELAEKAGLVICIKKYLVGEFNRSYHKDQNLFNLVFRDGENRYKKWLDSNRSENDIFARLKLTKKKVINSDIQTTFNTKQPQRKKDIRLNYDIEKLHKLYEDIEGRYLPLVERLNSKAIHENLKIKYDLHFDKEGLPTGRPSSYFCNTLNPKKKHRDTSGEFRPDFLKRVGLVGYHEVYDIKSEYPRVNYLFNTGKWKDDDYDFYNEIIEDSQKKNATEEVIQRGETKYSHFNDSMKQLFMRIYFGNGSYKQAWRNGYIRERLEREGIIKIERNFREVILDKKKYDDFFKMLNNDEDINYDVWQTLSKSVENICGPSIGNLVAWYSFFIETEVKIALLRSGKVVYNVYDGFYYDEDIKEEIKDLLGKKAKFVYNKFMKVIRLD
jgi:hypothetical protein